MGLPDPFRSSADDTHGEIMEATYDALREHGYADLTIQRIGDEFPKSKSLIYQHYDGKDDLLVDFLDFILDHFESGFDEERSLDPDERLRRVLDYTLPPTVDDEQDAFARVMTVLRGQAPYDDAFADHFSRSDRGFRSRLEGIVRDGVDDGTFWDADPERVAEYVASTALGTMYRRATTEGEVDVALIREELDEYLRSRLGPDAVR